MDDYATTLKLRARANFRGACNVCPVCDGVLCAGKMPGMGGLGTGATFHSNVTALAARRLNMHTIHGVDRPKLSSCVFGRDIALPVMGAPIGLIGSNMNGALTEEEYAFAVVTGCRGAGTMAMTGDSPNPDTFESGIKALRAAKGQAIPIVKPREKGAIVELAKRAADAGAPAFGIDIDAAALVVMTNAGQPVGPKTQDELAFIKENSSIPFIVKGVMTRADAEACYAAGADAIVVSNHGGRALDHVPGTAEVLPEIAQALKGKITILVDGGIRSGADVLKMLALGADAVLIGRPLAIGAVGGQAAGVEFVLSTFASELRAAMVLTGSSDVSRVSRDVLF